MAIIIYWDNTTSPTQIPWSVVFLLILSSQRLLWKSWNIRGWPFAKVSLKNSNRLRYRHEELLLSKIELLFMRRRKLFALAKYESLKPFRWLLMHATSKCFSLLLLLICFRYFYHCFDLSNEKSIECLDSDSRHGTCQRQENIIC